MNSFTSISLDPQLICVFVTVGSRLEAAISATGAFVVNVLKGSQSAVAREFSLSERSEKPDVEWLIGDRGLPILADSLAHLEAKVVSQQVIADHRMFVAEVLEGKVHGDAPPLIYYDRQFRRLDWQAT